VKNQHDKGMALITAVLVLLLTSTMIVGLAWLTMTDQKLGGNNQDRQLAFYGAESGMETLTARLENEFAANYAPTAADINALKSNPPTNVPGVQFLAPGNTTNGSGFQIQFSPISLTNPNPASGWGTIPTGPFAGLVDLNTPYTLSVTAHTSYGSEVKLQREVQTVAIPVFQFGVFSQTDLAFFSGTSINFGGRVHTNGNLWLQQTNNGTALTLSGKVTAAKEIITGTLENGGSVAAWNGNGAVNITNGSGLFPNLITATPPQSISQTQAWNVSTLTAAETPPPGTYTYNAGFTTLASGTYGGNIGVNETGVKPLNLAIATPSIGGQPIDIIRLPVHGEDTSNPAKLGERYYSQTSVRILLADYGLDGTCATSSINSTSTIALPNLSTGAPVDLATLAWDSTTSANGNTGYTGPPTGFFTAANVGVSVFPLPISGAKSGTSYTSADGYWIKPWDPIITGCIKIDYQDATNAWHDITKTILNLGYTGRNINPQIGSAFIPTCNAANNCPASTGTAGTTGVLEPNTGLTPITTYGINNAPKQVAASGPVASTTQTTVGCQDPSPNAVIRLARLRDNPSTALGGTTATNGNNWCGNNNNTNGTNTIGTWSGLTTKTSTCTLGYPTDKINCPSTYGTDYWPNVLFDTREGTLRDYITPTSAGNIVSSPTLAGSMYYVELDVANLAACLTGTATGFTTCGSAISNISNTTGYSVYFSDRRSERQDPNPPASVGTTQTWTGGYGYDDFVNPTSGSGCPNGNLDTGEDVESDYLNGVSQNPITTTTPRTYGNILNPPAPATAPTGLWPVPGSTTTYMMVWATMSAFESTATGPLIAYPLTANCGTSLTWPFAAANRGEDVRENPPIFFRRALKLVNGYSISVGAASACNGVNCGLTVVSENPVYVQGDYNNNPTTDATFATPSTDAHVGTSVIGDAVTLLSDNWNDVNSFAFPYYIANRAAVQTTYRTAVVSGKQVVFPLPTYATPTPDADMGTDGGVHNFLRYIESWNGINSYYIGSLVSMYYNHQAVGIYKYNFAGGSVYLAPARKYSFDLDFLTPAELPPLTPMLRDVNAIGFTQMILPTQ
jgi:hypothetical protein